ncbi:MAG: phosphate acyltransferase, partial [Alsobacter sp.]
MTRKVRISLDAMGGDHGPSVVIPGAAIALEHHPQAHFIVHGQESLCLPLLDAHPKLKAVTTFVHADV